MAIQFPSSPTTNQTYVYNSITWTYNGTAWSKSSGSSGGAASVTVSTTAPVSPTAGAIWLKDDTGDLYVYGPGGWVLTSAASFSGSYTDLIDKPTIPTVSAVAVSDQANTSTGYFDLPSGTTGQRPASPGEGNLRINSTTSALEVYYLGFWITIKSLGLSLAAGGTSVATDGNYKVHTFTTAGNFVVSQSASAFEVLLVAGGGGGAHDVGGGGGAGGLIYQSALELPVATYVIGVGAGGAGSGSTSGTASNGLNTTGFSLTAIGGGGGANYTGSGSVVTGATGGSGGGGVGYTWPSNGGAGTSGQGFLGGNGAGTTSGTGGGGGGATGAGANGISNVTGFAAGGTGFTSLISGTSTVYATGGKGGGDNWTGATSSTPNTGNGGDGQGYYGSGGAGAGGIVIIRYRYQ